MSRLQENEDWLKDSSSLRFVSAHFRGCQKTIFQVTGSRKAAPPPSEDCGECWSAKSSNEPIAGHGVAR